MSDFSLDEALDYGLVWLKDLRVDKFIAVQRLVKVGAVFRQEVCLELNFDRNKIRNIYLIL